MTSDELFMGFGAMNEVMRPWQLLMMALAGFVNRQQQSVIDYLVVCPEVEYYAGKNMESGYFRGVEIFGIQNQPAEKKSLGNLLKGFDPSGKPLVQRAGDNHRPGYDLTFSAPKSVSVLWALPTKIGFFKTHLQPNLRHIYTSEG